jgi:hypothetical protein
VNGLKTDNIRTQYDYQTRENQIGCIYGTHGEDEKCLQIWAETSSRQHYMVVMLQGNKWINLAQNGD